MNNERVLKALQEARTKIEAIEQEKNETIAIVGMAGRFPGANNIDEFWQNLRDGVNSIEILDDEELLEAGESPELINNTRYVKAYSSFENVDCFDADFFNYSPREAEIIDPQHRVFLECAWQALENAGYAPNQYEGAIGVYGGTALNSYIVNLYNDRKLRNSLDNVQVVISNVMGLMPTRVSYKLNLRGPSCGVQTGCSTSLVSVHLACQSLLAKECDLALAGGVTITGAEKKGYLYTEEGIASPDGLCRAFDEEGKGTVFGNGVGIVVLKRLSQALNDRDHIYAVIKGSAINNDGSSKVALTAPSVVGQAEAIATALTKANVKPETISYIETHGTGTALGDPIEISALNKVFGKTKETHTCAIGSVKTNLGHLDAAAGVTGLIKTVLALQNRQIPPSLNFNNPNPKLNLAETPFQVNTQLTDWGRNGTPRRAGVSSFGMGGTNAHVILEEIEKPPSVPSLEGVGKTPSFQHQLLIVSAKTEKALEKSIENLANYLESNSDINLADVAYTLAIGREKFDYRRFFVCENIPDAIEKLKQSSEISQPSLPQSPSVAFMFSGQGSQYVNMGRELYEQEPIFREHCDRCFTILDSYMEVSLRDIIYPSTTENTSPHHPTTPPPHIDQTTYTQPAIFIIEYALAKLWMSWGIYPQTTIGHSIGEYVAATIAGVFELEDALQIVATRGKLMQECDEGAMLSIALSAGEITPMLPEDLDLAVCNAPNLCVVSGDPTAIDRFAKELEAKSITCKILRTGGAFHSALMEKILPQYREFLTKFELSRPQTPFISNLIGRWITPEEATSPDYWVKHLRNTVQFADGIKELTDDNNSILLEVGAGKTLATLAKQNVQKDNLSVLTSLRHPKEEISDTNFILNSLGNLWLSGIEVDWTRFYQNKERWRTPLPTYPFDRQKYWVKLNENSTDDDEPTVKKENISDWFYVPSWKRLALVENNNQITEKQRWLLLADKISFADRIAKKLQELEQEVVIVSVGADTPPVEENQYSIDPHNSEDYENLIEQLKEADQLPQKIVYCWGLDSNDLSGDETPNSSFYRLLFLSQALTKIELEHPVEITAITNQLHQVIGTESINCHESKLLGLLKVLPQEYPYIACRHIDLVFNDDRQDKLVKQVFSELVNPASEFGVAYRDNYRWLQIFEPLPLSSSSTENPLRSEGVYVIAGDLIEGLGLIYAQNLGEQFNAKLILIGSEKIPEPEQWEQWLASHREKDSISRCIQKLRGLQATGVEFRFVPAQLADKDKVKSIIDRGIAKFGEINGVIHADTMGDRSSCAIEELDLRGCEKQFQSKVEGLLVLEQLLQGQKLDFFLLQSSLSSIVGGSGFSAYAGANSFMDAFANQRNNGGETPWYSLNWDGCQLEETDIAPVGASLVDLAMTPSEVWETTQRVLANSNLPQVVISPTDLQSRLDKWIRPKSPQELAKALAESGGTTPSADSPSNVSTEYVAPRDEVELYVAELIQDLLGIDKIGVHDNFFELGGHSLLAIQAVTRLREHFQVELPMREFLFESPNIAGIADVIKKNQAPDVEEEDAEELAQLLEEVENLSMEEVREQLDS